MPIVSISLTSDLLKKLDELTKERGFSSRSETIRDAVRSTLAEFDLSKFKEGNVTATITVISDLDRRNLDERLMRLRHEHDGIVSGNMHIHLGKSCCVDVFITEGPADEVLNFISRIRAMRGLQQITYTIVPINVQANGVYNN